jgi:ubiquitin-like protein Nedd8
MKILSTALMSILLLASGAADAMEVLVKVLNGAQAAVVVEPTDTVASLKAAVEEKLGIPAVQQRLIFGGKQLDGKKTLAECGITAGAVVHVVNALRGG